MTTHTAVAFDKDNNVLYVSEFNVANRGVARAFFGNFDSVVLEMAFDLAAIPTTVALFRHSADCKWDDAENSIRITTRPI